MKNTIIPNLWFDSEAEEAARLYVSLFKRSKIGDITHYSESGAEVSGKSVGSVLTVEFNLAGREFVALNGGPIFKFTPAISLYVTCESIEEVDRLYKILSEKGTVLMPLDKYPFSDRYAWITDRYGLSWQLVLGPGRQKITICLMFVKEQYGKAVEAMKFYAGLFKNSKIESVVPYIKSEGEKEGAIKHAEFVLEGGRFIAMDSGLPHAFGFTPAISLMVNCATQAEVDRFWKDLSAVPAAEQCGWLKDRYGVSWQIVPTALKKLVSQKDPVKAEKVMRAMLQMKKLDIKELKLAQKK